MATCIVATSCAHSDFNLAMPPERSLFVILGCLLINTHVEHVCLVAERAFDRLPLVRNGAHSHQATSLFSHEAPEGGSV